MNIGYFDVLRAGLVRWMKDYDKATSIVVSTSIIISYALRAFGFISIATNSFVGGLWILLIGWFLNAGAQSYSQQQELGSILSGVRLRDITNANIIAVKKGTNLHDVFTNYFEVYMKTSLPVVDDAGYLLGVVTLPTATSIPEEKRKVTVVDDIIITR